MCYLVYHNSNFSNLFVFVIFPEWRGNEGAGKTNTVDRERNEGWGHHPSVQVKIRVKPGGGPPYLQSCLSGLNQPQILRYCSTYYWKNSLISEPMQFKPVLFNSQLYKTRLLTWQMILLRREV